MIDGAMFYETNMKWSEVETNGCEISNFLFIVKILNDWGELLVNYYADGLKTSIFYHVIAKKNGRVCK
jgi:hypothetical protein